MYLFKLLPLAALFICSNIGGSDLTSAVTPHLMRGPKAAAQEYSDLNDNSSISVIPHSMRNRKAANQNCSDLSDLQLGDMRFAFTSLYAPCLLLLSRDKRKDDGTMKLSSYRTRCGILKRLAGIKPIQGKLHVIPNRFWAGGNLAISVLSSFAAPGTLGHGLASQDDIRLSATPFRLSFGEMRLAFASLYDPCLCRDDGAIYGTVTPDLIRGPKAASGIFSDPGNSPQRESLRSIYLNELGVREQSGRNDGSRVETYLQYAGLRKGDPWCAAFVCWCFGKAGITNPKSGWSPDLFPKSKVIWQRQRGIGGKDGKEAFRSGNIFGIWFADKGRIAHTGFIDGVQGEWIITVEGNTNLAGSREGDGVYRKRRLKNSLYQVADWSKSH